MRPQHEPPVQINEVCDTYLICKKLAMNYLCRYAMLMNFAEIYKLSTFPLQVLFYYSYIHFNVNQSQ